MRKSTNSPAEKRRRPTITMTVFATVVLTGFPLFLAGTILGYIHARVERGNKDVRIVNEVILKNPGDYSSVTINRGPLDKFLLEGTVSDKKVLENLKEELVRTFGVDRARTILNVKVES
jgi:hypothetical protein